MPKPTVYLETSFIGHLTGRTSTHVITAAHQHVTRLWWNERRHKYSLFVSDAVVREIGAGDVQAAEERATVLSEAANLGLPAAAFPIADALIGRRLIPAAARVDATHVSIAAVAGIDYLLTWNCTHIANATTREYIAEAIRKMGYRPATLCTPDELMGVDHDR